MIKKVDEVEISTKKLSDYKKIVDPMLMREIKKLSETLQGKKVVHVNTTSQRGGGGVAEILLSLVPLMRDCGLEASWLTMDGPPRFFEITKKIHNSLQGNRNKLSKDEKDFFINHSKKVAKEFDNIHADCWIIHDPQPLLLPEFSENVHPAISRIHIDLSCPNRDTWNFILPHFENFEKAIFSMREYANGDIDKKKVVIFPPAIDPIAEKNKPMRKETARLILENLGVNPSKPIVAQVSRFDIFKDPVGVVKAFYQAKNEIPNLQLVLLGLTLASDDPESTKVFEKVKRYAKGDPDIYMFHDPREIQYDNETIVNAVQSGSDLILQKSLKEGFGLTATEAMWKRQAVVAGNVGGLKLQIRNNYNGFLVNSVEECAYRIVEIIKDRKLKSTLAKRAKENVKKHFLLPRLLRDYLKLINEVVN
jgi:trehalose synthase